jgi:hypothetical protein
MWDSNRLLALGIFSALFLGAGVVSLMMAMNLAKAGSTLFKASLAELAKDRDALAAGRITDPAMNPAVLELALKKQRLQIAGDALRADFARHANGLRPALAAPTWRLTARIGCGAIRKLLPVSASPCWSPNRAAPGAGRGGRFSAGRPGASCKPCSSPLPPMP